MTMKISEVEMLLGEMNEPETWGYSAHHRMGEGKLKASLVPYVRQFSSDVPGSVFSIKGAF
jgi:hypothetical protein